MRAHWLVVTKETPCLDERLVRTSKAFNMCVVGIVKWTCTYWLEVENSTIFQGRCAHESRRDDSFSYIGVSTEDLVNAKVPIEMAHVKTTIARFFVRMETSDDRWCVAGDEDEQAAMVLQVGLKNTIHSHE